MNMSGNFGATAFPSLVAAVVTSTGNWNSALVLFVGLFGAAALCWVFLNPRGTLFEQEPSHQLPS
jgi:nitrate/nitrite transporter NarK